ncbi:FAD/NAD(P)-binding protein [Glarea lozoyensis ATCC 20868]|uniref:L-ornithine N(5)-monooxygenase [NAD(P)H] n=1 Tax=Glarea lozoyensis (strain ATCC 20868 / MF5171) TaxID=1116229 RepID=S3DW93_GLAL2|nr:FAD/NAD(P)-binding protein [Glarea lozoyensis ATCC 20868]EPE30658.1 FAD/NAD(P)-binding protein [Glarea lozoyensis ATCC 20868]
MEHTSMVDAAASPISRLQEPSSQPYDLICVGFGINSLALAAAIQENHSSSNVLFLEQKYEFSAKDVMNSSSKHMETSFMHDLATMRNPTSDFTYLNYLQTHGNFDKFLELSDEGSPAPLRSDFCEYLSWAAGRCDDTVEFGQQVVEVSPISSNRWAVASRDTKSGQIRVLAAKKVVFGDGKKARIAQISDADENSGQNEGVQMLQVSDAVREIYTEDKVESPDMRFTTLCTNTVEIHNKVFLEAEPLFIRALL